MEIMVDKNEWKRRIESVVEKWYDSNPKCLVKENDLVLLTEMLMEEFFEEGSAE